MDKREGQGSGGVRLHWETLGVGYFFFAPLQENVRGGDGVWWGLRGCILMSCTGELLRNFPAGHGVRFVFS